MSTTTTTTTVFRAALKMFAKLLSWAKILKYREILMC
jgi:hypothetical protein